MDTMESMGQGNMSMMSAVFMSSTSTPLYSAAWAPSTIGSYAGTCIFLIALASIFRYLLATKAIIEQKWLREEKRRPQIVVAGKTSNAQNSADKHNPKTATLVSEKGSEGVVVVTERNARGTTPWRLSVDLPRAGLTTIIAGVGYLLMLAVMTMNTGYFMSVLGGIFLGELAVGRYAISAE